VRSLQLAAAVLCLATGCTGPFQPSTPPELQIRGTMLLMPGARGRLTAWRPGDGQLREVAARWTAEGDAVSLSPEGVVTAKHLGYTKVRASYQDLVGAGTVEVVASVAGIWRGSIAVVDCWQSVASSPDPCDGRRGLTAPLVLDVSQSVTAENHDNLRAAVDVFNPPAHGSFIGAVDSSGFFFLDGFVQRPDGSLSGGVRFRWQLENNQLVPFRADAQVEDRIYVQLSVRTGSASADVTETWQLLPMVR
jgi:hypothetical protein